MKYKRLNDEENNYFQLIISPKKRIIFLLFLQLIALFLIYYLLSSYNYFTNKPTNVVKENNFYVKSNIRIATRPSISKFYYFHIRLLYLFKNLDSYSFTLDSKIHHLPELSTFEFESHFISSKLSKNKYCFIDGTNLLFGWENGCSCKKGYYGFDCGTPLSVYKSGILDVDEIYITKRNEKARRIVLSVILKDCVASDIPIISKTSDRTLIDFKETYDLMACTSFLDSLFTQTSEVVDLFLIGLIKNEVNNSQANFTNHVNNTLNSTNVFYIELISKNVNCMKQTLWDNIVYKISDFRSDDLIIIMEPFAFPQKEILLFLKLYDGFPEQIIFLGNQNDITNHVNVNVIANTTNNETNIRSFGITFQYFSTLCEYNFVHYLENKCQDEKRKLKKYESYYRTIKEWIINDSIY